MSTPKARWQPPDSTAVTRDGVEGVVYVTTAGLSGKLWAVGYAGKSGNHAFNFTFRTADQMNRYIANFFDNLAASAKRKAERKAEAQQFRHGFKVGDILHYSWGYDQTNAEFYQVTAVNTATITMRQIGSRIVPGSEGFMSATVLPCRDAFITDAKPMLKHPKPYGGGTMHPEGIISMDFGCATLHGENEPAYSSWYA